MNNGDDLLGLTLAEIGFFIAFVVLLVGIANGPEPSPPDPKLEEQLEREQQKRRAAEQKVQELQDTNQKLQDKIDTLDDPGPPGPPRCRDMGVVEGHLFSAIIVGENRVRLLPNSDEIDIDELDHLFERDLRDARETKCRHTAEVWFAQDVSLDAYEATLQRLRRSFYLAYRGPY